MHKGAQNGTYVHRFSGTQFRATYLQVEIMSEPLGRRAPSHQVRISDAERLRDVLATIHSHCGSNQKSADWLGIRKSKFTRLLNGTTHKSMAVETYTSIRNALSGHALEFGLIDVFEASVESADFGFYEHKYIEWRDEEFQRLEQTSKQVLLELWNDEACKPLFISHLNRDELPQPEDRRQWLALYRAVEPLAATDRTWGHERSWRELAAEDQLEAYVRTALKNERVILAREGDLERMALRPPPDKFFADLAGVDDPDPWVPLEDALAAGMALSRQCEAIVRQWPRSSLAWAEAQRSILLRVAEGLRVSRDLVEQGCLPQAQALGVTIYELAYTSAFIERNSQRSSRWLQWRDAEEAPWERAQMVREVRGRVYHGEHVGPDPCYLTLCTGRNGNPMLQHLAEGGAPSDAPLDNGDPSSEGIDSLGARTLWAMVEPVVVSLYSARDSGRLSKSGAAYFFELLPHWEALDQRMRPSRQGVRPA